MISAGGSFAQLTTSRRNASNQNWKASPMTYVFDNKQHVAVASGSAILSFGLPD
jgi:hypothetical protein